MAEDGVNCGLLWIRKSTFEYHKRRGILLAKVQGDTYMVEIHKFVLFMRYRTNYKLDTGWRYNALRKKNPMSVVLVSFAIRIKGFRIEHFDLALQQAVDSIKSYLTNGNRQAYTCRHTDSMHCHGYFFLLKRSRYSHIFVEFHNRNSATISSIFIRLDSIWA
jgi:hypothetical protein